MPVGGADNRILAREFLWCDVDFDRLYLRYFGLFPFARAIGAQTAQSVFSGISVLNGNRAERLVVGA